MSDKTTTLYKGGQKRRVGTAKEYRKLLAAGWSEKAPSKPAQKKADDAKPVEAKPAPKTDSK